ncbi:MAG: hypothetical protein HZC47_00285 [Methanobacterium sp.]|uniref:hypothetical protein n=1 Tax=Methanobacterium sp. TaxID=2164 RepID=UPI003D64F44A|nr:hypothetical protein [Methanobacterium sp.]
MVKRKKTRESKIMVGIRCQCQDRAVERAGSQLRQVMCKECGKIFKTNRATYFCFNCEKKKKN